MPEAPIEWTGPGPFADSALEMQYDQERRALLEPAPAGGAFLLLATLAVFILAQLGSDGSLGKIALLVGVLLFHELGHYAGMRLFGYRDVRMFFIPLFGAAVSGRRDGVAAWKEAVVLLLGPLPGIVLGLAVLVWNMRMPDPLKKDAAIALLVVNGFNLLPFSALDGGKLFQRLLFSRHRFLELGFLGLTSAALTMIGLLTQSWALAAFGAFGLVALPRRSSVLRIVRDLRRRAVQLASDPARLGEQEARALFLVARDSLPPAVRSRAKGIALVMREVLEAAQPAPGFFATLLLLAGWFAGTAINLLAGAVLAVQSAPPQWERYEFPAAGFAAEYPRKPAQVQRLQQTPFGELETDLTAVTQRMLDRFTVEHYDAPAPLDPRDVARWMDERRDALARQLDARVVSESDTSDGARELRLSNGRRVWRVRLVVRGSRMYTVTSSSPEEREDAARFLASFQIMD